MGSTLVPEMQRPVEDATDTPLRACVHLWPVTCARLTVENTCRRLRGRTPAPSEAEEIGTLAQGYVQHNRLPHFKVITARQTQHARQQTLAEADPLRGGAPAGWSASCQEAGQWCNPRVSLAMSGPEIWLSDWQGGGLASCHSVAQSLSQTGKQDGRLAGEGMRVQQHCAGWRSHQGSTLRDGGSHQGAGVCRRQSGASSSHILLSHS